MEIEGNFTGVIRGWKELREVTGLKDDNIRSLMIKDGFPKGYLNQFGRLRIKTWDRAEVEAWKEKRNAR